MDIDLFRVVLSSDPLPPGMKWPQERSLFLSWQTPSLPRPESFLPLGLFLLIYLQDFGSGLSPLPCATRGCDLVFPLESFFRLNILLCFASGKWYLGSVLSLICPALKSFQFPTHPKGTCVNNNPPLLLESIICIWLQKGEETWVM